MSRSAPHVVVVGGGIAGLTAAREILVAVSPVDVTVFEASREVGGKLRVGELAGQPVDEGAETMLFRRPEAAELTEAVGLGDELVHPVTTSAGIWTSGVVRPLPPTLLGIPADIGAAVRAGLLDRSAGLRARLERRLPRLHLEEDVSIGDLVGRRLGAAVRDRLVEPLLGGVYAGHARRLSAFAAASQLVEGARVHGSLLAAAAAHGATSHSARESPVFAGVVGGVGRLASAVARDVVARGGSIRCGSTVRELSRVPDGWQLVIGSTRSPEVVRCDAVVVACPAAPAGRLLRGALPAAAARLDDVECASMAIVLLAYPRDVLAEGGRLIGSGFLVPPIDGKTIKAATYASAKWGWMADGPTIVRCSIGRHGEEQTLQYDDAELVASAWRDLRDATGITASPLDAKVVRWGGALPQYAVGHLDRIAGIRAEVASVPGLAVCGATYDGIGIAACIGSARTAAHRVVEAIAAAAQ